MKTQVHQYPTSVVKGRRLYKGFSLCALFFFLVAVNTVTNFGNKQQTVEMKQTPNRSSMVAGHSPAGRGLKMWQPLTIEEDAECDEVHDKKGKEAQCEFVKNTESCENDEGLLEYNHFVYCSLGGDLIPLAAVILVLWWLFCFCGLAVCADDYFCPALVVISKTLRLSPNVASVTFLAFGNGAPDVFSAIAALDSGGDPGLGLGGLLGAGMFVTSVVCGAIAIIRPFRVMQRPFIRDAIFYLGGVYWTFFILWRGKIFFLESIGFLLVWVFYVIVVIVSGSIYKKQKANEESKEGGTDGVNMVQIKKLDGTSNGEASVGPDSVTKSPNGGSDGMDNPNYIPDFTDPEEKNRYLSRRTTLEEIVTKEMKVTSDQMNAISEGDDEEEGQTNAGNEHEDIGVVNFSLGDETSKNEQNGTTMDTKTIDGIDLDMKMNSDEKKEGEDEEDAYEFEDIGPLRSVLEAVNPINIEEWPEMRWWVRIYEVFKSPLVFLIQISCPVVNYEIEETWNWNKYLFVLQSFIAPTALVLCMQVAGEELGGVFPVYGLTLIIGAVAAIVVWFTSVPHEKPKYIEAFGWVGFFVALGWIYIIANEVVAILQALGIVMKISTGILGLTLLAWGNSIGDLIADTVMARQGFARMGFSACFGGPFFNLSLGFGIPMVVSMIRTGEDSRALRMTPVNLMLTVFLMGSLVLSLLFLIVRKFAANRPYGLVLMVYYVIFLVMALLAETGVIMDGWRPS